MDPEEEARAFLIARKLIAEHGDNLARVLEDKIDGLMAAGDHEQLSAWFVIRNAVAISLRSASSLQ
ncbi:MAG: hypothetical protein WC804_21595 [Sphingomonas sp.]|jgi:hypothetical protein|uniref:hypothetical protein n=1 Tax=Sphingomonas sp. TaxID=28214 RepID=UPI0035679DD9